jgi:hypothetical protein
MDPPHFMLYPKRCETIQLKHSVKNIPDYLNAAGGGMTKRRKIRAPIILFKRAFIPTKLQ